MNTQFRIKKGIEVIDGNISIFYGKGVPDAASPKPIAELSNGDLYHDADTQRIYRYNGTAWVLSGILNRLGAGEFDGNYIDNVDDSGVNTFTKAVQDLDTQVKSQENAISLLVSGSNPQGFIFAITEDSVSFGSGVAGPVPLATQPIDADENIIPEDESVLFHTDGTKWIYNVTNSNWVKDSEFAPILKDMWAVKYDLPDRSGQELTALYIYTSTGFVKFGEVSNDVATAIGLSNTYAAAVGTVSTSDTVQSAIQKLDGNVGDRIYSAAKNVTNGESASAQIEEIDNAIGQRGAYTSENEITNDESVVASLDAIDIAIGDRNSYASNTKIVDNGDSVAAAIGKLDQAAGFAINTSSSSGALTAAYNRLNVNNALAVKWFVTVIETPISGKGAVYTSELIAIYRGAGTNENDIDYTEYGVVKIGDFDAEPAIVLGFSGGAVNIAVTANKAGSIVNVTVKGMLLGEFLNNIA
jgi:hypothetical protein